MLISNLPTEEYFYMPVNKFKQLCDLEPQLLSLSPIIYNPKDKFLVYLMKCEVLRIDIYLKTWGNKKITKDDYDFLEKYLIPKNLKNG